MSELHPLVLPQIPAELNAAKNRIHLGASRQQLRIGDAAIEMEMRPEWTGGGVSVALQGMWGGVHFSCLADAGAPAILEAIAGIPTLGAWAEFPPVLRLAVWEAALEKGLEVLAKAAGEAIALTGIEEFPPREPERHPGWLFMDWHLDGSSTIHSALRFLGTADDLRPLAALMAGRPSTASTDDWPIEVTVELASQRIGLHHLKSAAPGDIIVVSGILPERAVARIGRKWLLPVRLSEGAAIVMENEMTDESDPGDTAKKGSALEGVEVNLTLELDSRMWQVRDLARVQPGFVFETGKSLASPITLKINGREWGKGEMVDIDGKVGVRLLTLS
ncbi:MAG: FliM/FliN family flagellar motor switch protein [Planctomycetaceae bacterium]|nr:FliM/FliN family flagellar motor switch protein [Planctomycetaceae bacterium]